MLEQPEFPRSYSIEFRGPEKIYLPIPGLPKKGVNQLFACAVRYPDLHVRMENYARLAMREDEWYNNLSDESCAMPGTFAVFALGLEGPKWWRLVCDYLDRCDDEHSSLQEKFIHTFFKQVRVYCPVPAGAGPRSPVHAESEARKGVPRPDRQ